VLAVQWASDVHLQPSPEYMGSGTQLQASPECVGSDMQLQPSAEMGMVLAVGDEKVTHGHACACL
jgi:hypothetical protein